MNYITKVIAYELISSLVEIANKSKAKAGTECKMPAQH